MATRKQITDKVKKEAEKKKQDQKKKQQQPFQDERTHVVQRQQQTANRNAGTVRGQVNSTIQKIPDKVASSVARANQPKQQQPFRKQTLDKGSSISARIKATSPANMAEQKKQKDREGYTISGMEKNLPKELTSAVKQKAADQKKKKQENAQKNKERALDNSAWHQDYIDESRLSAADRANLPPSAKRQILDLKDSWEKYANDPTLSEETKAYALDKFHRAAEIYRNYYGHYSGGEAGTDYQKTQMGAVKNAPKDLQSALQTAYAYGRNALDDSYDDSELKHIMQVYSQSYKDNKDMIQNLNPEMDRMEKDYNELKKIFGTPDYNNGSGNMFENKTEPGWKGMSEEEAQAKWQRYQGLKDIFDRPWWERIGNTLYGAGKQSEAGTREAIGAFFENGNRVNPSSRYAKEGMDIRAQMEASAANQLSKEQYRKSESANIAASRAIEEAKRGGTRLDKVMVDVGVAGAQMLGDMAMSAVAPGLGTAALATRAFGGAHQQARLSGATEAEAMAYGLGVGAIEVLTNKLFSASTPMKAAYGKGLTLAGKSLDDVAEQAFGKVIKNPVMAKWVWSATSEGLEEVLADVADPILRGATYGEIGKPSAEAFAGWMYDGLIGAILGGIGGAADINQVRKVGAAVIQNDVDGKAISEMIRTALKKPEGTKGREIAEELQSAMAEGQMPSAVQVGELVRENATVAEASGVISEQKTAEEVEEALDPVLKTQEYSEAEEYPEFSESDIPPETNNNAQEEYAQEEYSEGTQKDDALSTQAISEDEGTTDIATDKNASESVTAGNESGAVKEDVRQEQKILRDITDDYRLTLKGDNTNEVRNGQVEERKVSKSPAGQIGILQESAGRSVSRTQRQAEADGKKALQRTVWEGKKFSAKELNIKDGSAKKTATAISRAEVDGNAYLSAIRDRARDNGVQVAFYSGALESGNMMLRGVHVQESGIIYVQVDDPEYSPEQIADHELFHVIAENDDNLVKEVAKEIQKRYTDEDLMKIAEQYIKAYDGAYDEDELDAIMEEILADAFAGMNSFANDVVEEVTKKRTGETPLRLRADVETEKERGPPDIESDEAWEILDSVGVEYDKPTASAKFSASTHNESDYVTDTKNAAKILAKALGITQKKARAYIEQVNGVAAMILSDRVRWDFKDSGLSAFVTNVEYGGSIDNSTLCSKRRVFTGTFSAIQRALPNTALTAEEFLEIRNMMKERGYEVSCGCCYVEGSRANLSRLTKEFIKKYGQTEHDYMPTVADLATPDGLDIIREEHPEVYDKYVYFMNNHGTLSKGEKALFASQQKPKMFQTATAYKGEILKQFENKDSKIDEKNDNGGIRFNSFSDTEIIHLIDNMQAIMDMSRVGLAGQGYTKQGIFARAFGGTGMKINLSLISGGLDENGKLIFDPVEGMAEEEAMELRDMYPDNVGTIIVVFNDKELLAALADDRIDYIIPFHRSQWKKSQYVKMGLRDKIKDFTNQQNEKFIKKTYHEYRGRMVPDKCTNLLPNTYWNFKKSGKWNAENYLRICAEGNRRPKFYKLLDKNPDGSYSLKKDGSTDGYWKLLIDFKMYNHITGKGVPQRPVRPDFNMDAIYNSMEEYKGGHETYPVAQDVVDDFVSDYKKSHKGVKFSGRKKTKEELDADYRDAVESGDMETAQRMVDQAAKDAGYTIKAYHGTLKGGFNVFDKSYAQVGGNSGAGFYFSSNRMDSVENYSDVEGADNYFKAAHLADRIMEYGEWDGEPVDDYDEALAIAKKEITKNPQTYVVYLKQGNKYTRNFRFSDDIMEKIMEDFDEGSVSRDDFDEGEDGDYEYEDALNIARSDHAYEKIYEAVYGAIKDLEENYEIVSDFNINDVVQSIAEDAMDYGTLRYNDIRDALRDIEVDVAFDGSEYESDASPEFVRAIVENFGYDSIEDNEVSTKFNQLKNMNAEDTSHYIMFKPYDIKLASAATYNDNGELIPLSERFDKYNNDIRFSGKKKKEDDKQTHILTDRQRNILDEMEVRDIDKRVQTFAFGIEDNFHLPPEAPQRAKDMSREIAETYLATGTVSDELKTETFNRLLENGADGQYYEGQDHDQWVSMARVEWNDAIDSMCQKLQHERDLIAMLDEAPEELEKAYLTATNKQTRAQREMEKKFWNDNGFPEHERKFIDENGTEQTVYTQLIPYKTWVRGLERGNFGRVIGMNGDKVDILFKNKSTGKSATVPMKLEEFAPVAPQMSGYVDSLLELESDIALPDMTYSEEDIPWSPEELAEAAQEAYIDSLSEEEKARWNESRDQKKYRKLVEELVGKPVPNLNTGEDRPMSLDAIQQIAREHGAELETRDMVEKPEAVALAAMQIRPGKGGKYNKDLSRNLDDAAGNNKELRSLLRDIFEKPLAVAKKEYTIGVEKNLTELHETIVKDLGIKPGSKESAAVQWYGEGKKYGKYSNLPETETAEYGEIQLREEFPRTWQKIKEAERFFRNKYDEYLNRINASLEKIYPALVENAKVQIEKYDSLAKYYGDMAAKQAALAGPVRAKIAKAQERMEKTKSDQVKLDMENSIHYNERRLAAIERRTEKYKNNAARVRTASGKIQRSIEDGSILKNKRLVPRQDYFHHFKEMESGFAALQNIITTNSDIDSGLANMSEYTKPLAKWASWMQKRHDVIMDADAVGGMVDYIPGAEFKIALDPYIARGRDIARIIAACTEESRNANSFLTWYGDYLNDMLGKTNPFDRPMQKLINRKTMGVVKWVNARVRANAIVGNVRTMVAQFFNLPNATYYIPNPVHWASSAAMAVEGMFNYGTAGLVMKESSFLRERYNLDSALNKFDNANVVMKSIKGLTNFMLSFGDEVVSKWIWAAAYHQGVAKNEQDPILYADDITRRSVAGRGIGEIPLTQQAQITKLVAPFQVEVNNQWELIKEAVHKTTVKGERGRALAGIVAMLATSYIMNAAARTLVGSDISMDIINAIMEACGDWDDEDNKLQNLQHIFGRIAGEIIGNMPFGSQISSILISDETMRQNFFGESDPSRFGTGNIGINAVMDPIVKFFTGKDFSDDLFSLVTNIALPFGGRQIGRFVDAMQIYGILPEMYATNEGIQHYRDKGPGGTSYTSKQGIRFALDNDPITVIQTALLGQWATKEGKEFLESGSTAMQNGKKAYVDLYRELTENGMKNVDAFNLIQAVKNAQGDKGEDGKTISGSKELNQLNIIMQSNATDEEKMKIYLELAATGKKADAIEGMKDAGESWTKISDAIEKYIEISQKKEKTAEDKKTEFGEWAEANLNQKAADAAKELKFTGVKQGSAEQVSGAVTNKKDAEAIADAIEEGKGESSDYVKYQKIAESPVSEKSKQEAILSMMDEKKSEKYQGAIDKGISSIVYFDWKVDYNAMKSDPEGTENRKEKKDYAMEYINNLNLTAEQKDYIYLTEYKESGLSKTPWH